MSVNFAASHIDILNLFYLFHYVYTYLFLHDLGKQVIKALENGVSGYPRREVRFPQVAGISFAFDPSKVPGQRVDPLLVRIGDEYLNLDEVYLLATKGYMRCGCDGYAVLKEAKVELAEDICPYLILAVQNHFRAIDMRLGKTKRQSKHRQSLVTLSRRLNTSEHFIKHIKFCNFADTVWLRC